MKSPIHVRIFQALIVLVLVFSGIPATRAEEGTRLRVAAPLAFLPPDAQGAGMGEALTALSRGPEAGWWNPAALPLSRGWRAIPYSRSDRLLPRADDRLDHFAAAWGGVGIGLGATWTRWDPGDDPPADSAGIEPLGIDLRNQQEVATVGLGIDLSRLAIALPRPAHLTLGAAARGFREECPPADQAGSTESEVSTRHQGWDIDGAALLTWRLAEPSRPDEEQGSPGITCDFLLGYVAMNAFDLKQESCAGRVPMGRRDRASGALVLQLPVRWWFVHHVSLSAAFERRGLFLRAGEDDRAADHAGAELVIGGIIAARAGQVRDPLRADPAARERWTTWGAGLRTPVLHGRVWFPGFGIDYADLGQRTAGHPPARQVTASIRFR